MGWHPRARLHQNISFSPAIQKLSKEKFTEAIRQSLDFILS